MIEKYEGIYRALRINNMELSTNHCLCHTLTTFTCLG